MYGTNHFSGNDGLKSLGLSVRAYSYCISRGIATVQQLLDYYSDHNGTFPAGQNAGYYTISELARKCKEILESKEIEHASKVEYGTISDWHVSVRAYNVLQSYRLITKKALIQFYRENRNSIPDNLRNCGRKTIKEIEDLCRFLLETEASSGADAPTITNATSSHSISQEKSKETISSLNRIVKKFLKVISFNEKDLHYLSSFNEQYGHFPLLWILSKYVVSDDDVLCFARAYGIDTNKGVKSPIELAEERKVTRSRIRMRISRGYQKLFGSHSDFNNALKSISNDYLLDCFGDKDFISSSDRNSGLAEINNQEGTFFSNAFILKYLSIIFKGFKTLGDFEGNRPNPEVIVLNKGLCSIFNFNVFFTGFDSLVEDASKDYNLNLREYVEDSPCWSHFSMADVDRVLSVAKAYALSRHGLYEEYEVDTLHILPKKYDVAAIVYTIVSEADTPLTLQDIIRIASEQYPRYPFQEDEVRIALREDTRIQYIRRGALQSQYLLASRNAPTSIRDAVVKVLGNSDIPVLLDDIVSYVLAYFPNRSKNSIRTSLLSDGQNRFIQYEGGRYGLSSRTYPPEFVQIVDSSRMSFAERLILLKKFLDEKCRFPSVDSSDGQEVDFAKWIDRNQDRQEVKDLIGKYAFDIWASQCMRCEYYIIKHNGKIPPKDKEPQLYKWLFDATMDLREDRLTQEQRKMFLHLKMQIRQ